MKVLILHQHFNLPEKGGALRSYYLARALTDRGVEVVVITGANVKTYRQETRNGIEIHYLPIAYNNSFGFVARSFSFLKYVVQSIAIAKKIRGVDYCYAISAPLTVGLAAIRISKALNVPYLFEVGDLWPDAPIQMGYVKNHLFISMLYRLEKVIYHRAQAIVALSQPIKGAIEKKIQGKKIFVLPNMADCEFYKPTHKDPILEEKFAAKEKFVIAYIGTMGAANGLDHFVACANASRIAGLPIQFILCGEGAVLGHLKKTAGRLGLNNITFTGFVNRTLVREVMNVTDAVFVCYQNVPILQTGSPNKYFDGLASGKLIIVNFGGWIKEEIEATGCGFHVDSGHPIDFVRKVESFIRDKSKITEFQRAARNLAESRYNRNKLSDEFARCFGR